MDPIEVALREARRGFSVLPIDKENKKPRFSEHGFHDATNDPDNIAEWFTKTSGKAIAAIVPGSNGMVVLDVDDKGTHAGSVELAALEAEFGKLPDTYTVTTPSGGRHLYFKKAAGSNRKISNTSPFKDIDVRADGGYVAAAGSETPHGMYRSNDTEVATLPEWLDKLLLEAGPQYVRFDPSLLDELTRETYEYLVTQGWRFPHMLKGTRWSNDAYQVRMKRPTGKKETLSAGGCSIGYISPGTMYLYTSSWEGFEPNKAYDLEDLKKPEKAYSVRSGELWTPARVRELSKEPQRWLLKGWIEEGQTIDFFGEWGTGKSFVGIDWMMHLASGRDWHGARVKKPVSVVYVVGEARQGWPKRVEAWQREHGDVDENWAAWSSAINLFNLEDVKRLEKATRYLEPQLFIFDTFAACTTGADGDNGADTKVAVSNIEHLKENGAAVLLLNHPGHAVKDRSRGSSVLHGHVDITIRLATENGDRNDPRLILSNDKNRDQEKAQDVALLRQKVWLDDILDEDGDAVSTCVIVPREAIPKEERAPELSPNEQKLLQSLNKLLPVAGGIESGAFKARAMADHGWARDRPFYDALKKLVDSGYVTRTVKGNKPHYNVPPEPDMTVNMSPREAAA